MEVGEPLTADHGINFGLRSFQDLWVERHSEEKVFQDNDSLDSGQNWLFCKVGIETNSV